MIHQSGREKRNLRLARLLLKWLHPLSALFLLAACGQSQMQPGSNQTTPVGIVMALPKAAPASAGPALTKAFQTSAGTISKVNITVRDTDGVDLLSASVDVTSDTVDVDLDVPAGLARIFIVEALDANGKVLFRGLSDSTDLVIGVPKNITIQMVQVTGPTLTFGPYTRVSEASGSIYTDSAGQRGIAYFKGNIYTVWYAFNANNVPNIYFAESGDGTNWTQTPLAGASSQSQPSIAVGPDGSIYIAYLGLINNCSTGVNCFLFRTVDVLVRHPGDPAFSSLTAKPLFAVGSNSSLTRPSIAVSPKGVVFVTWSALLSGSNNSDVYLTRINGDGTLIDSIPKNLTSSDSIDEQNPVVAVGSDGDVFLGYELTNPSSPAFNLNSFVTASLDGGGSFLPAVQINPVTVGDFVARLTLAPVSGGFVHIAWEEDTCGDGCTFIAYSPAKVSQDAAGALGLTVDPGVFLGSAVKAVRQTAPSIASDGFGGVYIAFHESVSGVGDGIFLAKTTDDGKTFAFSPISQDGRTVSIKDNPSLAVDIGGRSFVIWTDNRLADPATGFRDVLFSKGE
jgi:hypothetical protein